MNFKFPFLHSHFKFSCLISRIILLFYGVYLGSSQFFIHFRNFREYLCYYYSSLISPSREARAVPGLGRPSWVGSLNATMLPWVWVERAEPESRAFGKSRVSSDLVDMPIDTVYMSMDMPCHAMPRYASRRRYGWRGNDKEGEKWGEEMRFRVGGMVMEWGTVGGGWGYGNWEEKSGRRVTETVIWRPTRNGDVLCHSPTRSRNWCLVSTHMRLWPDSRAFVGNRKKWIKKRGNI